MAGEPGRAAAREAAALVWAVRERYTRSFPLPESRVRDLYEDLSTRLTAIHRAEVEAVAALSLAIARS